MGTETQREEVCGSKDWNPDFSHLALLSLITSLPLMVEGVAISFCTSWSRKRPCSGVEDAHSRLPAAPDDNTAPRMGPAQGKASTPLS